MEAVLRGLFQFLARNKLSNALAKKYGLQLGANRFVAGDTIDQAIEKVTELNKDGRAATLDHLGEFVSTTKDASESAAMCLKTLDAISNAGVESHLSLKLTSLGLDISRDLCLEHMRAILDRAKTYGNFVRIDMEDYGHCQQTIDIYKELRKNFDNVGIVIQAYLYRSANDLKDLNNFAANLRLVKGAYKESSKVAYPDKSDVDTNFKKLIEYHLQNSNYTAIATHDSRIIDHTKQYIKEKGITKDQYEYQMLYGICEDLQKQLVQEGFKVRVYVPYGKDWYAYFMRRLAERPANVWFVLKNMLG